MVRSTHTLEEHRYMLQTVMVAHEPWYSFVLAAQDWIKMERIMFRYLIEVSRSPITDGRYS